MNKIQNEMNFFDKEYLGKIQVILDMFFINDLFRLFQFL